MAKIISQLAREKILASVAIHLCLNQRYSRYSMQSLLKISVISFFHPSMRFMLRYFFLLAYIFFINIGTRFYSFIFADTAFNKNL